jgi:hypothetical protein
MGFNELLGYGNPFIWQITDGSNTVDGSNAIKIDGCKGQRGEDNIQGSCWKQSPAAIIAWQAVKGEVKL